MRIAANFVPGLNQSVPVQLLYQEGDLEIINDSPYLLTLSLGSGGTANLVPFTTMLYPMPAGGGMISILPVSYFFSSPSILVEYIVVNEYHPGELSASAYPFSMSRSVNTRWDVDGNVATVNGNLNAAQSISIPGTIVGQVVGGFPFNAQTGYASGITVSIGKPSTSVETAITLLDGTTVLKTWFVVASTSALTYLNEKFINPFIASNSTLFLKSSATSSTGNISLTLYGWQHQGFS